MLFLTIQQQKLDRCLSDSRIISSLQNWITEKNIPEFISAFYAEVKDTYSPSVSIQIVITSTVECTQDITAFKGLGLMMLSCEK